MKKAQRKDFFVEIKRSLNRYLSILAIVALGVAFFSGIRSAEPDMRLSVDRLADEANFMDIRVLSTMGLTEEDLESIRQVSGITAAEGEYSVDALSVRGDTSLVLHVASLTEEINKLTVTEGRLPENPGECLIDSQLLVTEDYAIGDTITLESGTEDPLSDSLKRDTFTIVGVGISPYYLNFDRGTAAVGNGSVDGFLMVLPEEFSLEVYTQIYATADSLDDLTTAGDSYQEAADAIRESVEDISGERCQVRLEGIRQDALEEINDGQQELDEKRVEAEAELDDAWQEIVDAEAELADGQAQISENEQQLADGADQIAENEAYLESVRRQIADGEAELADGQAQISENEQLLAASRVQLEAGTRQMEETKQLLEQTRAQVASGQEAYDQSAAQLEEQSALVAAGRQALEDGKAQLEEQRAQLESLRQALEAAGIDPETVPDYVQGMQALQAAEQELAGKETELEAAESALASGREQLEQAAAQLETGRAAISQMEAGIASGEAELSSGWQELESGEAQLEAAKQTLAASQTQLETARQGLADGEAQLEAARQELADGQAQLEEAKQELADGQAQIEDAKTEYEDAKAEAERELADAQEELDDARAQVDDLELPEWYVLDRTSVQSYVEYDSDADKIGALGAVFPVVFFLVAALVSLTTMTRMVEEKRTEIGTMKALGYGTLSIASKYIGYALSATLIGSVLGFLIGEKFIPWVIITTYKILYVNLTVIEIPYNWGYALGATGISILCTAGAALAACYKETLSQPAQLMRPVAPLKGKKILLERIRPLWKHLSFSYKSTLRNLFRYKKRLFMTVFGIGACMALLLVGFGLRDSIYVVSDKQYGELWLYDVMAAVNEGASDEAVEELRETVKADSNVEASLTAYTTTMDGEADGVTKEVYLLVPEDEDAFQEMFILRDRESGEAYTLGDEGAVISEKLARMLGISEGDEITLSEGGTDRVSVPVSHIVENYVYHYVYLSPALYEQLYGEAPQYNAEYLMLEEGGEDAESRVAEELLSMDAVSGITMVSDMNQTILDMLGSLDMVVWVLIVSAGLLAFVVLYNLNNINITERKRELATIKLLGFYDLELAMYVYRENVLLTLIGILTGILMGNGLHRFVIETVEVDMIMFGRTIHPISYLFGIGLTLLFAVFVNVTMFYKLRKIDMVESLKSVE